MDTIQRSSVASGEAGTFINHHNHHNHNQQHQHHNHNHASRIHHPNSLNINTNAIGSTSPSPTASTTSTNASGTIIFGGTYAGGGATGMASLPSSASINSAYSSVSSNSTNSTVPVASNLASLTMDEVELYQNDKRYKQYCKAIDGVLKKFESTSEWADLVEALGKLKQAIDTHVDANKRPYPVIPRRFVVGQRLAQCCHPALPSGVHLKALEAYDQIFTAIGIERLIPELSIYSNGLFPLLSHAAINVKPALLDIYEKHFVPLNERLRPALEGFLIAVLPGYEEGSEYLQRVDLLLKRISEGVGLEVFYGALWRCILNNNSVRLPAISFLVAHFNKRRALEDQLHIMGTSIETLINGICAALLDSNVFVERAALDLLLLCFPMHNHEITKEDMIKITTAAVTVLLKRDITLNRRLYSWIFGLDNSSSRRAIPSSSPSPSSASSQHPLSSSSLSNSSSSSSVSGSQSTSSSSSKSREQRQRERKMSYFESYSKNAVLEAFKSCLSDPCHAIPIPNSWSSLGDLWPYRLFICFLDHQEICAPVTDQLFIEVFRALYFECKRNEIEERNLNHVSHPNSKSLYPRQDLVRTMNLLLSNLGIGYVFKRFSLLLTYGAKERVIKNDVFHRICTVQRVGSGDPTVQEMCALLDFILSIISMESYPEIAKYYLPEFFNHILITMSEFHASFSPGDFDACLTLLSKILGKINFKSCALPSLVIDESSKPSANSKNDPSKLSSSSKSSSSTIIEEGDENSNVEEAQEAAATNEAGTVTTVTFPVLLQAFAAFFDVFVQKCFVINSNQIHQAYSSLIISDNSPEKESGSHQTPLSDSSKILLIAKDSLIKVFMKLCKLQVQLSACNTAEIDTTHSSPCVPEASLPSDAALQLPDWLCDLLILSVKVYDCQEVSYTCIQTLLELMTISKASACNISISPGAPDTASSPVLDLSSREKRDKIKTMKPILLPLISHKDFNFICEKTTWFTDVARKLWDNLREEFTPLHLQTAKLLQKLHNLALDSSICESVICMDMVSPDDRLAYEARKKFILLYDMTRDIKNDFTPSQMQREFDRPLFLMLDSLTHKLDLFNAQAVDWINYALKAGDIARILEPLLFILLHPDTARVSIQHVSVLPPQPQEKPKEMYDLDAHIRQQESKIYAIGYEDGKMIYHVADSVKKPTGRDSPIPSKFSSQSPYSTGSSSSYAPGQKKSTFQNFNKPEYDVPSLSQLDSLSTNRYASINMVLNPFGSMSSLASDFTENNLDNISQITHTPSLPNLAHARRMDLRLPHSSHATALATSPTPLATPADTPVPSKRIIFERDATPSPDKEVIANLIDELLDIVAERVDGLKGRDDDSLYSYQTSRPPLSEGTYSTNNSGSAKLNSHLLLYTQVYDSKRTLYALTTLWNILLAEPQRVLFSMATTSISNRIGVRSQELQLLCARHKSATFGKGFYADLGSEYTTAFRSSSFLEIIVNVCLSYLRSYYPNLPHAQLTEDEVLGNQRVRILTCEILRVTFSQLVVAIKGRPTFSTYLHDLLLRCKVQKIILHCLVSSVCNYQLAQEKYGKSKSNIESSLSSIEKDDNFATTLIEFNDRPAGPGSKNQECFLEDFQKCLLKLLEELMILEHKVAPSSLIAEKELPTHNRKGSDSKSARIRFQPHMASLKFYPNILIPSQSMFISAIQTALQSSSKSHLIGNWLSLIEATLPYAGRSLTRIVICVVSQLCHNLEQISKALEKRNLSHNEMAPNNILTCLKSLTTLCHYCLLDASSAVSTPPLSPQPQPPSISSAASIFPAANPLQVITNFLHVFAGGEENNQDSSSQTSQTASDPIVSSRKTVLSHLPRILACLLTIWKSVSTLEKAQDSPSSISQMAPDAEGWQIMGNAKEIKHQILSFLSPISLLHGPNFMGAVAVVWYDYRDRKSQLKGASSNKDKNVIPPCSEDQNLLVELVAAIRVLPMESVLQTVRHVLRSPPNTSHSRTKKRVPLEVCMLQFFLAYIRVFPGSQLLECWKSLLLLLRDGLSISSPALPLSQLHLLAILHEFVQAAPLIEDKKDQKDLQDVAQKLVEACTQIAGARLAQTKWLRRNLEVRPGPQHESIDDDYEDRLDRSADPVDSPNTSMDETVFHSSRKGTEQSYNFATESTESMTGSEADADHTSYLSKYSVQALCALAEFVAPVLDVVYVSDEKEKVVPLVTNIIYYVTPYLRNHSKENAPSYRACSHLLSSISGYQYTRKAWKRDAFELLLDPGFFQMDCVCVKHWKVIVDHLMTHDKTSFRDFLGRVSVPQPSSLKLFGARDAETERSQLLKRLAFILFCSERDQYQRYLPEIQEKLIESLRLPNSILVQSQVLFCFRVLITRMSSHHLTSLWPFIYTEMVQVFLQIEMRLLKESSEFSVHVQRMAALESSLVITPSNGLSSQNHPAHLPLFLNACKLLDLALSLPADSLPQFQMYRWAFVGASFNGGSNQFASESSLDSGFTCPFEPHVVRIAKLMNSRAPSPKMAESSGHAPLLRISNISHIMDLHPFFSTLASINGCETELSGHHKDLTMLKSMDPLQSSGSSLLTEIDKIIEADFLETMQD